MCNPLFLAYENSSTDHLTHASSLYLHACLFDTSLMTGLRFAAFKFAGEIHGQNVVSVLMLYHVMLYVIQLMHFPLGFSVADYIKYYAYF